eukprot:5345885-Prymnesium_polylepis.3
MSAQKPHSAEVSTLKPSQEKPSGGSKPISPPPRLSGMSAPADRRCAPRSPSIATGSDRPKDR